MKKAKNKNGSGTEPKDKRMNQKCDQCGGFDICLAAKNVRGKIKWICYNCYRKDKGK